MKVKITNKSENIKVLDSLLGDSLDSHETKEIDITEEELDHLRNDRDISVYILKRRTLE